ncbi:MAG: prephenate dehydrogenase [Gemmatimonadales bacterium]
MHPSSLAVIGLGAIGGSLAWQARLAGVIRVVGYSPLPAEGIQALKAGAITELADTPLQAAGKAEIVVLAVPPRATLELIGSLASVLAPGAVLTDVCSVKEPIIRHAVASGLGERFAGGHPLAGTHQTGFLSASPERLRGCVVYVCETGTPAGHRAAAAVAGFWEHTLNASPVLIDPAAHDRQLAWTSHLPQAVGYALAKVLAERGLGGVSFGSGAKDTTRLAASNPEMWVDILLLNRSAVVEALEQTRTGLQELQQLLSDEERGALLQFCETARDFRLGIER